LKPRQWLLLDLVVDVGLHPRTQRADRQVLAPNDEVLRASKVLSRSTVVADRAIERPWRPAVASRPGSDAAAQREVRARKP
jgi:hypothetical protein